MVMIQSVTGWAALHDCGHDHCQVIVPSALPDCALSDQLDALPMEAKTTC